MQHPRAEADVESSASTSKNSEPAEIHSEPDLSSGSAVDREETSSGGQMLDLPLSYHPFHALSPLLCTMEYFDSYNK